MKLNNLEKCIRLVVASLAIATCTASAGTYVDKWRTSNGKHVVIVAYDLDTHVVHMFMPDGRDVTVAYDPAITKETLDAGLRKIADKEASK
jgi:hypothetical protein